MRASRACARRLRTTSRPLTSRETLGLESSRTPLRHQPEAEDRGAFTEEDPDARAEQWPYRVAAAIDEDLIDRRSRRHQGPQRHQRATARPTRGVGMLDARVLNLAQRFEMGTFKCFAALRTSRAARSEIRSSLAADCARTRAVHGSWCSPRLRQTVRSDTRLPAPVPLSAAPAQTWLLPPAAERVELSAFPADGRFSDVNLYL
jgi:hypothetical protein